MYAISTLLLVAYEASRVRNLFFFLSLNDFSNFSRCANIRCGDHVSMSIERGDDRPAAVRAKHETGASDATGLSFQSVGHISFTYRIKKHEKDESEDS